MYVMSLTHSWLGAVGMNDFTRLGYVGRPWLESVVRGARILRRLKQDSVLRMLVACLLAHAKQPAQDAHAVV